MEWNYFVFSGVVKVREYKLLTALWDIFVVLSTSHFEALCIWKASLIDCATGCLSQPSSVFFFLSTQSHRRQHNKDKPYKCHNCNRGYTDAASLEVHLSTHTVKHAKLFSCGLCNRSYTSVGSQTCQSNIRHHTLIMQTLLLWQRRYKRRKLTGITDLENTWSSVRSL